MNEWQFKFTSYYNSDWQLQIILMSDGDLSQDAEVKIMLACLENIKKLQEDPNERKKIENSCFKLARNKDSREILALSHQSQGMLNNLLQTFHGVRKGFDEVSKASEYSGLIKGNFNITNYLLSVLPNLPIKKDNYEKKFLLATFFSFLTNNFKKILPDTSNKFMDQWYKETNQKLEEHNKKALKQISEQVISKPEEKKMQQKIPATRQLRSQKSLLSQTLEPKQETEESLQHSFKARQIPKQSEKETSKRRDKLKSNADQRQQAKLKAKAQIIEKYIQSRKDLTLQKGKSKEVSEFLALKLESFLKHTINQLYDIACLKNKKDPQFCNQLRYFAQDNSRIEHQSEFYFYPSSKIYSLSYKNKFQIYNNLRQKELKNQDELRNALEAKNHESPKKIDRRIEHYIFNSRSKQNLNFLVPREEQQPNNPTKVVAIGPQHVIYFFKNHPWLKNSQILFNTYQYL